MSLSTAGTRRVDLTYHGGLDGLRGLAVIGVVLYHGGVAGAGGGFLGVEMFFVLSGFLITSLLLAEWRGSGQIALGAFWGRRARRLLPALLVMVAVVGIYYALAGPDQSVPSLKSDGLSTLLYAGNWHQILSGSSYFAATGPVSPLQHTWSLAIEEQFYVFWPLLLLSILWLVSRRERTEASQLRSLRTLLGLSLLGVVASAIDTALLFQGGRGLDRVYYGTDTRAGSLLMGASLAIALSLRRAREPAGSSAPTGPRAPGRRPRAFGFAALLAGAAMIASMSLADGNSTWLYPYGLVALDLAVALVIAAVVLAPRSPVSRLLTVRPLRALGKISYGVYLWHFPLFLWLDEGSTGVSAITLLALRLGATLAVSVLSFVVIEQPIRRRKLARRLVRALTPVAAGGALASLLLGSALSSVSFSDASAASLPQPPSRLEGSDPPCQVKLTDTKGYGLAPLPAATATRHEYSSLGSHKINWTGARTVTFHTCPPSRVLVVGDSLAYTLGVGLMQNEQRYGLELADAAVLGCAFTTQGDLQVGGTWEPQSAGCPTALTQWAQDAQAIQAKAVVVELGYRDQFDWRSGGKVEHLGQAAFDAYLRQQIDRYVQVLGAGGRKVLFLSVPWSKPPANRDGSASPAAAPARHAAINAMLKAAAQHHPNVGVLDIDKVVSPANKYQGSVGGHLCRFDGIHFTLYCSELLQPDVLGEVRQLIGVGSGDNPS
jgi:peptidoglycan/LPS O-acetylase OafA/YrhL